MRRLIALILLALSLALTSGPAFAVRPDCPMAASSSSMVNHDEMDCCKAQCAPSCATLCPGAVVPSIGRAAAPAEPIAAQLIGLHSAALHSRDPSGADPPPRTTFS
ncbi:MAG: hypothetical protein M3Q19_15905 [Pseudomonadota bacterium]|nr:hypothetical protein [Pseudomonadota bacterium]